MGKGLRSLFLVAGTVLAWWLLAGYLPGHSERFYLLVPPFFVAFFLLLAPGGWAKMMSYRGNALAYVGVLLVACLLFNFWLAAMFLPLSPAAMVRVLSVKEILCAVYFLGAVLLLISLLSILLKWAVQVLDRRCFGPPSADSSRKARLRGFLAETLSVSLLLAIVVPYLLGLLFIHRMKMPNVTTPLEALGRPYDDVRFHTADGYTLRGWFIPCPAGPSDRTVIICHGLGANRSFFLAFHTVADALDANVLMFDFRGHGDSDGHTVTVGHYEKLDVLAAVAYLRSDYPGQARRIVGLGQSMGSAGLVRAAAEVEPPFEAVILDSGFASAIELTDNVLGPLPDFVKPLVAYTGVPIASLHAGCCLSEIRPVDQIADVRAPVLIIHAREDALIPVQHAHRLYEHANSPKKKWIAETGNHGSALRAREEYLVHVVALVRRVGND